MQKLKAIINIRLSFLSGPRSLWNAISPSSSIL